MHAVWQGLVSNALWAVLGAGGVLLGRLVMQTLPTRRLWRIKNPKELIVCTATSARTHTGEYVRPATGIGQLRAIALAVTSLNRGYKKLAIRNVLLSEEPLQNRIENDLLILGGEKNNAVARMFLDKIRSQNIVDQSGNVIYWHAGAAQEEYVGVVESGKVTRDFGLIVRMQNPFSSYETTVCLLAGSHTYGTIAAARYFTEMLYKRARRLGRIGATYAAIVSCDVVDGYPGRIRLEREYSEN